MQPDIAPFSRVLFMEASKQLRRKSAAKFARYQHRIGRPVPKSWTDRAPDPGTYDNEPELVIG